RKIRALVCHPQPNLMERTWIVERESPRQGTEQMRSRLASMSLPVIGILFLGLVWAIVAAKVQDLPSPLKTWEESKIYVLQPLDKRGEMDQGILRLAYYSLVRVGKGFLLGVLIGTTLGFMLGLSKTFNGMFDSYIQVLLPI